jgi:hypothetical protein
VLIVEKKGRKLDVAPIAVERVLNAEIDVLDRNPIEVDRVEE